VTLWANGTIRSQLRYDPWGKQRYALNVTPTGYRYTAQRFDDKLGLYDYQARYYDPHIGRFISADVVVPQSSRLTPLTVGFHETMFLEQANGENRQLMEYGPASNWSGRLKQQLGVPAGPAAPQTLNRFAYANNNPLVYTDPTGHDSVTGTGSYWYQDLTEEEAWAFINAILGLDGEVGWGDYLQTIGFDLQVGLAVLAPLMAVLGIVSWGTSIVLGVLAVIGAEGIKQLGATLNQIANLMEKELEKGSKTIRIEISDGGFGTAGNVIVRGKDSHGIPIGFSNPTIHFLSAWMYWSDYSRSARYHAWWHINHVTWQYGR
jgi:RHS repeat-associated protein